MIGKLDSYRCGRDSAARYAEQLNDEAFQHEAIARVKRELAKELVVQVNEDVPIPLDAR